jgi:flagellar assembly factor FliW
MPVATELRVLPRMDLTFPVELPGIKGVHRFRLEPLGDRSSVNPFGRLIALEPVVLGEATAPAALRLVVAAPALLWPDLEVEIDEAAAALLEIEDPADAAVVVVVTLRETLEHSSANLLAPIVINTRKMLATQIVPTSLDESNGLSMHAPLPLGATRD